ncbi:MAG: hypothetical protein WCI73_04175 [Phycisphaerae bacterium]
MRNALLAKIFLTTAAAVVSSATLAWADSAKIGGFGTANITIVTIQNGQMVYTKGSDEHQLLAPLDTVSDLRIESLPTVADAEKALTTRDFKTAADLYGKAIQKSNSKPLQLLLKARQLKALDGDNRYLEAVRLFYEVFAASPTAATFELRPQKLPEGGSKLLTQAATFINGKLTDSAVKAPEAQKLLKSLLLEIYQQANDPKADALARELGANTTGEAAGPAVAPTPTPSPTPAVKSQAAEQAVHSAEELLAAKKYDEVIALADATLLTATNEPAIRLFTIKALAYEAKQKPELAALSYLCISTFYGSSYQTQSAEAMYHAAELLAPKQPDAAKRLYQEIIQKYPRSARADDARAKAN